MAISALTLTRINNLLSNYTNFIQKVEINCIKTSTSFDIRLTTAIPSTPGWASSSEGMQFLNILQYSDVFDSIIIQIPSMVGIPLVTPTPTPTPTPTSVPVAFNGMYMVSTNAGVGVYKTDFFGNTSLLNTTTLAGANVRGPALDSNGDVYVVHGGVNLSKIDPVTGTVTLLTNSLSNATDVVCPRVSTGKIYILDKGDNKIKCWDNTTSALTDVATDDYSASYSMVMDPTDSFLYVSQQNLMTISIVDIATGIVSLFAGTPTVSGAVDGALLTSTFSAPRDMTINQNGYIYVAELLGPVRRIDPFTGVVETVCSDNLFAICCDWATETLYGSDGVNLLKIEIPGFPTLPGTTTIINPSVVANCEGMEFIQGSVVPSPTPTPTPTLTPSPTPSGIPPITLSTFAGTGALGFQDGPGNIATFSEPWGTVFDSVGTLYVADTNNHVIRSIDTSGNVSTVAGTGVQGATDGVASVAEFRWPYGVVMDGIGNLYISDRGNHTIRVLDPLGNVSTFAGTGVQGATDGVAGAAEFFNPEGMVFSSTGDLYIVDNGNSAIRKIDTSGNVTTFATSTNFSGNLSHIAIDALDNLYVSSSVGFNAIYMIDTIGTVSVFAGTGTLGSQDGTAMMAEFNLPAGLTFDSAGNLFVADLGNSTIRMIDTSGNVTTIMGLVGTQGNTDGTNSTATLYSPASLAFSVTTNALYVGDIVNHNIRKIS